VSVQDTQTPEQRVIGVATKLGITFTAGGFAAAVLAFIFGDHSQQTLGTVGGGTISIVLAVVTMIGRYKQANLAIAAQSAPPTTELTTHALEPLVGHVQQTAYPNLGDVEGVMRMVLADYLDGERKRAQTTRAADDMAPHSSAPVPSSAPTEPVIGAPTDLSLEVPAGSVPPSEKPPEWAGVAP
jgi:hypothetical protein